MLPPKQSNNPAIGPPEPPVELVSDRFPRVKKIRLEVEFHDPGGIRVQRRCRDLVPEAPANFQMKCPLDAAPADLLPLVSKMVAKRLKQQQGELRCTGSRRDSEHIATYSIAIEYRSKRR